MRRVHVFFDFDTAETRIDDSASRLSKWRVRTKEEDKEDPRENLHMISSTGAKGIVRYANTLTMAILLSLLAQGTPAEESVYIDLYEQFKVPNVDEDKNTSESISKAVGHMNKCLASRFDFFKIKSIKDNSARYPHKKYRFTTKINSEQLDISWDMSCSNPDIIEKYHLDENWKKKIEKKNTSQLKQTDKSNTNIKLQHTYDIESVEEKAVWDDLALDNLKMQYNYIVEDLNPKLLPQVKVAGSLYNSLPDFICDVLLKQNREVSKENSFSILDGGVGSGKTYSLFETARRLVADGNRVIAFELSDVYNEQGTGSLIRYICRFIKGNINEDDELRLRNLLTYDPELKADSHEKIVFIIDGIDEVSSLQYRSFAVELNKIARIANPHVFFILGTRNADDFLQSSGLTEGRSVFRRWDNISMVDINYETVLLEEEEDLRNIMVNNPITRTPLFVSYYRENQALAKGAAQDSRGFLGSYGSDINVEKIKTINNYYDLFYSRTELLCAHAKKNNINPSWYSAVLPCLAYYMHQYSKRDFDCSTIEELFDSDRCGIEFKWFNRSFTEEYGAFRNLFPDEKLNQLLGTRIVKTVSGKADTYKFEHEEYMYFLAALFASQVIRKTDDEKVRNAVLEKIDERTSLYVDDRLGKMLYIPFARYTFMDSVKNRPLISQAITSSRRGRKPANDFDAFDPKLYQIAANVAYESKDVYDEAKILTQIFLNYQESRHKSRSRTNVKEDFETWKMINNVNVIDYSMITRRSKDPRKWEMLQTIESDLSKCATVVLRDAFEAFECPEKTSSFAKRGFAKDFPLEQEMLLKYVEELTEYIKKRKMPTLNLGRFPVELLSRLISNIGAAKQEMAKYQHNVFKKNDAAIDSLDDALKFHTHALQFRETLISKIDDYIDSSESFDKERLERENDYLIKLKESRKDISVIRSLITLGTDNYYFGDYVSDYEQANKDPNYVIDYEQAKKELEEAVSEYHNKALERHGIDPRKFGSLSYCKEYPVKRTLNVQEIPHVGAEPFVICRRAAGAYYLLFDKTIKEIASKKVSKDKEAVTELKRYAAKLIKNQFAYLKATYTFLYEACSYLDEEDDQYKLDRVKLEINAKEIDGMWTDTRDKFIKTIPRLDKISTYESSEPGKNLIERIFNMYKELHPLSQETLSFAPEEDDKK